MRIGFDEYWLLNIEYWIHIIILQELPDGEH